MVSYTTNYILAMYDAVTDASELFLAYRSDMAGTSSSNVTKIETALTGLQTDIDTINANKSAVFVDAGYVSPNLFQATGITGITAYATNLKIILRIDTDSDGTVTLNINSLGIKSVYRVDDSGGGINLVGTHLRKNKEYLLRYNGTVWIIVSDSENPAVITKNIESLSVNKTLTDYSEVLQDLDPNGSDRDVNLPAEDAKNPYFVVYNSGSGGYTLTVKDDSPATVATIENGQIKTFYSTGTEWVCEGSFSSPLTTKGDLHGFDTADTRVSVGADGKYLKSNSSAGTGIEWGDIPDASDTVKGIVELATIAEMDTGTDTTRPPSVDSIAGSDIGTKGWGYVSFQSDEAVEVGNGINGFCVPGWMSGWNIIDVVAAVNDKGVTGTTTVQVRRRRAGANVDVLSTRVTIGNEFFASDGIINTSNDDLAEGDLIYIDVDTIHTGTAPDGLSVSIGARLP